MVDSGTIRTGTFQKPCYSTASSLDALLPLLVLYTKTIVFNIEKSQTTSQGKAPLLVTITSSSRNFFTHILYYQNTTRYRKSLTEVKDFVTMLQLQFRKLWVLTMFTFQSIDVD